MTRKSFAIRRVKAIEPREDVAAAYLLRWTSKELFFGGESFPRITSPQLFGNNLPLELEIGCGTGEFLCGLAGADPAANYLGLDISLKSLFAAVGTAHALSLCNVKFVKAAVQLVYPLLEPDSLRAIYVHFPDPCLHPKYRKRRVFTPALLDNAHRALMPGGSLSIVTDQHTLFAQILSMTERDMRFRRAHDERFLLGFDPPVKSRYQSVWERHGSRPMRLLLEKAAGQPPDSAGACK